MSSIPDEFTSDYYNQDYFRTPGGKKFLQADGTLGQWSYNNPDGEFKGAKEITLAWKEMFKPANLLDVGCGRGTFVAYAREAGIEAFGFDYSEWAVNEGRYPNCNELWLAKHDATKHWPYIDKGFDLVVALDFYEHIYESDLNYVIGEMFRVAKKWVFLQIATAGSGGLQGDKPEGYVFEKGRPVPVGLQGCAAAGHVTVRNRQYWLDRFESERDDWMLRRDMVNWFTALVDKSIIANWLLNTILVYEKVD